MKHTPGPWKWKQTRGNNRYEHHVFTYEQNPIAQLNGDDPGNIQANAGLSAAAPDLLKACKLTIRLLEDMTTYEFEIGADASIRRLLNNAIQKATE